MPRGAPKGNNYAKKQNGAAERGIGISYYLDAYDYEFLQMSVVYDGKEPTDGNVRAKAKKLFKSALTLEVRKVFARYQSEHPEL